MYHLTREVRLTVGGRFLTVQATLCGPPDATSGYVMDIKEIDRTVRRAVEPILHERRIDPPVALDIFAALRQAWDQLDHVRIGLSPYTSLSVKKREYPMVRFSQMYEFSAAHRLDNPSLSREDNARLFGKCNNPHGHGHNYELEVTLRGNVGESGQLLPAARLDDIVTAAVLAKFDHKFLNLETAEFAAVNPTVENIAQTIYTLLKAPLTEAGAELAEVTVWETPKTWCRYEQER